MELQAQLQVDILPEVVEEEKERLLVEVVVEDRPNQRGEHQEQQTPVEEVDVIQVKELLEAMVVPESL
jgi:hypothetical protein